MPDYMYRCNDCGEEFDDPMVHEERHPEIEWGSEFWEVCPCCGSCSFEEIEGDEEEEYEDD